MPVPAPAPGPVGPILHGQTQGCEDPVWTPRHPNKVALVQEGGPAGLRTPAMTLAASLGWGGEAKPLRTQDIRVPFPPAGSSLKGEVRLGCP